jgi:hypothetical protein
MKYEYEPLRGMKSTGEIRELGKKAVPVPACVCVGVSVCVLWCACVCVGMWTYWTGCPAICVIFIHQ